MANNLQTKADEEKDSVIPARFSELKEVKEQKGEGDNNVTMDRILDIPVTLSVELGRTRVVINDLLQLSQGSVIELNKLVGEPMEILVNDRLVAMGEVVVVNEKFGVRLTDIVSPMERIKQLKK
ncbi:MAG: flagellar motor switch protein FliN [Deltaproteobacteria bacterium]|nr:flagellar motor switch protein FliN [Deltaproteobacteria bacterium]